MADSGVNQEAQEGVDCMKNKDWKLAIDLLLLLGVIWLLYMIMTA